MTIIHSPTVLIALLTGYAMVLRSTAYVHYSAMVSFWFTLLLPQILHVLFRHGWYMEASLRTVAITMTVCWIALMVRGLHALAAPQLYFDLMQPGWVQGLTLMTAFLALIGVSFGFLLANFERTQRQMEQLASHDELTGCYNRATARSMLEHLLDRCRRERTPMALVLRRFSEAVRLRLRASDVFGRMGGEEFCIGLPLTDRAGALELAEDLRQTIAALSMPGRNGLPLQITAEMLYGAADDLLYRAKHLGRNRVMIA